MPRRRKFTRDVNGILLYDKPIGVSSNKALQEVKRLYKASKAGHTGSLDPIASGLIVICLGEATKVSSYLLETDKYYRATCKLGIDTTTGDSEGDVVRKRKIDNYSDHQIARVLGGYTGRIEQIPPMYSALKHKGKRLYDLARQGLEVERKPRSVHIYKLQAIARSTDTLTLYIECSKGTYIRTLIEDLGETLGCGAHVIELRRLGVGPYRKPQMVTLEMLVDLAQGGKFDVMDTLLLPIDSALTHWPDVRLTGDMTYYARSGQPILVPGAPTEGNVRLYDNDNLFIGVGTILDDGRVAPKRLIYP